MSKVKVSKEVFEAFKKTEGPGWYFDDKEKYLSYMIGYKLDKSFGSRTKCLNDIRLETFLKALNDGYELELTQHEKVLENYNLLKYELEKNSDKEVKRELNNCINVMLATLNNLGVYIEGVNK